MGRDPKICLWLDCPGESAEHGTSKSHAGMALLHYALAWHSRISCRDALALR